MLDLSTISEEVRLARGDYSTVRAAHEDEKKNLAKLCSMLQSVPATILRQMQPDNDEIPESVESLLYSGRNTLDMIEACADRIESLAKQRAELKSKAWSR